MTEEKVSSLLMSYKDSLPADKLPLVREKLLYCAEEKYTQLTMIDFKSPTAVLLFAIFLGGFGVDRFVLKQTGSGVAKLLFGWATCGIWYLVDMCTAMKRTKEINLQNLLMLI